MLKKKIELSELTARVRVTTETKSCFGGREAFSILSEGRDSKIVVVKHKETRS